MQTIASNNDVRFTALITNVNEVFSNRDSSFRIEVNSALTTIQTNVTEHMAVALGEGLMLRGSITMGGSKQSRGIALASAAYTYITACLHLYKGHDEVNLQRCLSVLVGDCLPQLVSKNSKTQLMLLVTKYKLVDELKLLISDLKEGNEHRRYDDAITSLEMYLQMFEGKMSIK
jgi:hypothetical protein